MLLALCFVGAVIAVVGFNNSDVTRLALATATSNFALVERIGEPIHRGWFVRGSIQLTSGSGSADLAIPVSGPIGKGTLYALAVKTAGVWKLTLLQFGTDGDSNRLQLLQQ